MPPTHAPPKLVPIAPEEAPVLRNLLELYAHDFTEYVPHDLAPSGRFEIPLADPWWTSADHFPFFIHDRGVLCGFALVRRGSHTRDDADAMDIAELFVVRGARKRGLGREIAHQLFERFPGRWEIRVRISNGPALKFWKGVAESWLGAPAEREAFTTNGVDREVLRFDSRKKAAAAVEESRVRFTRLRATDVAVARRLFAVMAEVFESECDPLSDAYVARLLADERFWAIAAFSGDAIVGGITAHTLPMTESESSEVFIYDVAVRVDQQRRGIGRGMMSYLRSEAVTLGVDELFVPADDEDTHALDFYRALGGAPAAATIFTFTR